jgi:glycerol 3-phosphatase-2
MSDRLADAHDVAFFDLDGVVYRGPDAVPGAVEGIEALHGSGTRVIFVTNNASRSAQQVADHLTELGFPATTDDLITSAQVAASVLAERLPAGSRILVAGSRSLAELMSGLGFIVVESADDAPDAVIQGYDPQMTWPRLNEAALAVQRGATWYATNSDSTLPTNRGILPGLGAMLNVVGNTVPFRPTIFGKPHRPMLDYAHAKAGAERPIFVGDRLDTDVEGANNAGMASLLVFSGVHGKADLVAAEAAARPSAIGADLRALLQPVRELAEHGDGISCGASTARVVDGNVVLDVVPDDAEGQLDALWALAHVAWRTPGVDSTDALARLDLIH